MSPLHHLQHVKRWPRKGLRPSVYNNHGLGFIMPSTGCGDFVCFSKIVENIPFERIGRVIGFSLTVYGYVKIVIIGYRYSQKLLTKFREQRQKNNLKKSNFGSLKKQAQFLVISIYGSPSVRRRASIYKFAVS